MKGSDLLKGFSTAGKFNELNWSGSFQEYLDLVQENPLIACNAFQRLYEMISSYGYEDYQECRETLRHWKFFDDADNGGLDAVFGLDRQLNRMVELVRSAALGYGPEKRVILLHGPVGSAKSTIARLFKKGLEKYSRSDNGKLYTFQWKDFSDDTWHDCPMHEEPLKLIPEEFRGDLVTKLVEGKALKYPLSTHKADLDPACRKHYLLAMERCNGDWHKMIETCVRIKRVVISEKDRVGIGTYQPKDEKSQDATELTGDINFRKIAKYGSDSDPRAFNFDGEFNVANRGMIEFVEMLKLDVAFLYDLLGATQEHRIKPRKFAQTEIDEVIIGHTNGAEFKKLQQNEFMEALRDRTIRLDIGYPVRLDDEMKIYNKDYRQASAAKHLAPHTVQVASMFSIMTRLQDPHNSKLNLMQKLKLYNGKTLPGFTLDNIQELKEAAPDEGMSGISPRFIQDKLSNALVSDKNTHVNPFIIMNEIEEGLKVHSLITSNEQRKKFIDLLQLVKEEYTDIVKNEVQRAICADEEAIARLCQQYIDNVKSYCQKEKVKNKYTKQDEEPDETLMRSIEEKIDISNSRKEDFRREILNYIGALAIEGKKFHYWTNERLQKALELKLFEDSRHSIKLSDVLANVVDKNMQEKIDVIKTRLIKNYGYNTESASDVLAYVSSIFSRGDAKNKE